MNISVGQLQVNLCSAPAFMGHEELCLPMLVYRSTAHGIGPARLGGFWHCDNDTFQPNDLSRTVIGGHTAGGQHQGPDARVTTERILVGLTDRDMNSVPEIGTELDKLGLEYAFFVETSSDPLNDGFISRCRLISRQKFPSFHSRLDAVRETEQVAPARDVLHVFISDYISSRSHGELYGDYFGSRDFRHRFGDDDQFAVGYAVWLEQAGVVRAWTRLIYIPK